MTGKRGKTDVKLWDWWSWWWWWPGELSERWRIKFLAGRPDSHRKESKRPPPPKTVRLLALGFWFAVAATAARAAASIDQFVICIHFFLLALSHCPIYLTLHWASFKAAGLLAETKSHQNLPASQHNYDSYFFLFAVKLHTISNLNSAKSPL